MAKKKPADDVSIGKFDILATYTYAKALLDGLADERGQGAGHGGGGHGGQGPARPLGRSHHDDHKADKDAAEKKKKTTITAESFDHQVADKMGGFFDDVFLPTMKKLVEAGPVLRRGEEARRRSRRPGGPRSPASSSRSGLRGFHRGSEEGVHRHVPRDDAGSPDSACRPSASPERRRVADLALDALQGTRHQLGRHDDLTIRFSYLYMFQDAAWASGIEWATAFQVTGAPYQSDLWVGSLWTS